MNKQHYHHVSWQPRVIPCEQATSYNSGNGIIGDRGMFSYNSEPSGSFCKKIRQR